jgi:rRNA maturation endonuclease Nob1
MAMTEKRRCNVCGEEWTDDGDDECFYCGSDDTEIVIEEGEEEE